MQRRQPKGIAGGEECSVPFATQVSRMQQVVMLKSDPKCLDFVINNEQVEEGSPLATPVPKSPCLSLGSECRHAETLHCNSRCTIAKVPG